MAPPASVPTAKLVVWASPRGWGCRLLTPMGLPIYCVASSQSLDFFQFLHQ